MYIYFIFLCIRSFDKNSCCDTSVLYTFGRIIYTVRTLVLCFVPFFVEIRIYFIFYFKGTFKSNKG